MCVQQALSAFGGLLATKTAYTNDTGDILYKQKLGTTSTDKF